MITYKAECVLDAKAELGECPIWYPEEQCLYWIDIPGKTFNRFDPASGRNRTWNMPEMPGSFVLREGGGVVIAMRDGIYDFDPASASLNKRVDAPYDSRKMRFNDGRTDRQGRFWVGSMPVEFMDSAEEIHGAFYSYDGASLKQRIAPIEHANGTVFTIDGKTMFRAETTQRKIFAYDLDPTSGDVSNERLFVQVSDALGMPDGATIDDEGGYWSALPAGPNGGSVARYTPDGKLDVLVELPVLIGTMPAFGGPDLKTLYVTTGRLETLVGKPIAAQSGGLFAVEVPFRGVPETTFKR